MRVCSSQPSSARRLAVSMCLCRITVCELHRQNYIDLATVSNNADVTELLRVTSGSSDWGFWIGLMKSPSSEWRWSLGDPAFYTKRDSLYRNWAPNQTISSLNCAYMNQDGL
ncbi:hypothetical protein ABG768_020709 [Culter alburnus]|uniref:C-type lectin domain-containing protein n=1 Tax=Culter alburnus TaxID=194366 RepID=A0AAW2B0U1_CULAL